MFLRRLSFAILGLVVSSGRRSGIRGTGSVCLPDRDPISNRRSLS